MSDKEGQGLPLGPQHRTPEPAGQPHSGPAGQDWDDLLRHHERPRSPGRTTLLGCTQHFCSGRGDLQDTWLKRTVILGVHKEL